MAGILIILFFALLFETDIAGAEGYIFLIIVAAIMLGMASDWIKGMLFLAIAFLAIAIPLFCIGWAVCWVYEKHFEKKRFY